MRFQLNKWTFLLLIVATSFAACKDDETASDGVNGVNTTPYALKLNESLPPPRIPMDNPLTVEGVELGRMLFYDPILSGDSSQACADCHAQELAFTDHQKALSTGIQGLTGKRNSMPIFNLAWHDHGFFWDGRSDLLRHQSLRPIEDPLEMDESLENALAKLNRQSMYPDHFFNAFGTTEIHEEELSLALEQFMMSIVSADSKFDRVMKGEEKFTSAEQRGADFFNREFIPDDPVALRGGDCFHCHGNSLFMAKEYMNNGLDTVFKDEGLKDKTGNPLDAGLFKVPSLRNIAVTGPYMHDGRFKTLEEVLDFYSTGVHANSPNIDPNMHALSEGLNLTENEKSDLLAFLNTLTDTTYLNNKTYSNPFK